LLKPELLEILACPSCKGTLRVRADHGALDCLVCKRRVRVEDDMPIMLLDEAEPLPETEES